MNKEKIEKIQSGELEKDGLGLLLVDLTKLPKTFSYRRYKEDLTGFAIAFALVFAIVLITMWLGQLGG